MERIIHLLQLIRSFSFFQRLFSWKLIMAATYDAIEAITSIKSDLEQRQSEIDSLATQVSEYRNSVETKQETINSLRERNAEKDAEAKLLTERLAETTNKVRTLEQQIVRFESAEKTRQDEHSRFLLKLDQSRDGFENYKQQLHDKQLDDERKRQALLKTQWAEHEANVSQIMKGLSQKHIITYVDDVPFKGNPDNTVQICDEYVIFDAKSPAGDDFSNFPNYLKSQAEAAKKYAKQENVRKDIYLVVPSSTVDIIKQWSYDLADYRVYVITTDAIEPVLLSLKRLEDYEFMDQMSPEDRENVARLIGKFAHTTKRRVQVDQFFANQFLDLLKQCEHGLPREIMDEVLSFEKAEKLNPPVERRAKRIELNTLEEDNQYFMDEAGRRNIAIPVQITTN